MTREDERASFTIVNDDVAVSFKMNGSTVSAIVEAFSYLPFNRRVTVLERLKTKHAQLVEKEKAS